MQLAGRTRAGNSLVVNDNANFMRAPAAKRMYESRGLILMEKERNFVLGCLPRNIGRRASHVTSDAMNSV